MVHVDVTDIFAAGWLFLFTGADVAGGSALGPDTILEIISKFGVVAVLWYWLKDMKNQLKENKTSYNTMVKEIKEDHKEEREKLMEQIERKDEEIENLHNKLFETIEKQI
jgi:septal ring factor EnvC (AmiA/AmiB activator)